jgi:hypothetical protein
VTDLQAVTLVPAPIFTTFPAPIRSAVAHRCPHRSQRRTCRSSKVLLLIKFTGDNMADASSLNFTKNETPVLWEPAAALSMLQVCTKLKQYLAPAPPIALGHMLAIFFHESGFANIKQGKNTGPAVGFGQMEIFNLDKIPFFKWLPPGFDSITHNPNVAPFKKKTVLEQHGITPAFAKLTHEQVKADPDFAIKMHCKYFEWLFTEGFAKSNPNQKGIKDIRGLLAAQTGGGGNEHFIEEFAVGGENIGKVIGTGDREAIISALNEIRWYFAGPKGPPPGARTKLTKSGKALVHNPISLKRYPKYWDFTLPDADVAQLKSA